jgi:trigger factor
VGKLVAAHDFPLPASLVENELTHLLEDLHAGPQEGKEDDDELRAAHRAEAESRVKAGLLIAAIAKTENIVATPADVSAELEALARRYGQPAARIRKALGNNVLSLVDGIVRNKTLDFLIDNAIVAVDEETPGTAS